MKRFGFLVKILLFSTFLFSSFQGTDAMHGVTATRGQPWPLPAYMKTSGELQILEKRGFEFAVGAYQCDLLEHAFRRYFMLIFKDSDDRSKQRVESVPHLLPRMVVTVKTECNQPEAQIPTPNMDESCEY